MCKNSLLFQFFLTYINKGLHIKKIEKVANKI